MAKRSPAICTYCCMLTDAPELEHVFPSSWYPEGTAPSSKLVVPACASCNRGFSELEDRLRSTWLMSIDATHPACAGLWDVARRGMSPSAGRDAIDARRRAGRARKVLKKVVHVPIEEALKGATLPRTNPTWGVTERGMYVFGFEAARLDNADVSRFLAKLVRGMFRIKRGEPLPQDVLVRGQPLDKDGLVAVRPHVTQMLPLEEPSPAFRFRYLIAEEKPHASIWFFSIWAQLAFVGYSRPDGWIPKPAEPEVDPLSSDD